MFDIPEIPGAGPLWLTVKLAACTVTLLLLFSTPLALWLSYTHSRMKTVIEAIVALPIVLPPTVLGFYLLIMLGPGGAMGSLWQSMTGSALSFSFTGLVIASAIYSLPFVVQPLQNAFTSIGREPVEAAVTLGASPWDAFRSVTIPLASRGFLTATVLGFAHTLGEFGVVLMVGGNIPGETRVVSIAIYDHVESMEYGIAHGLSIVLLVLSFLVLWVVYGFNRKMEFRFR
ncbi:MAG: molybdate ABC transporter permease subunit [Mariprofundaceae bacterium]